MNQLSIFMKLYRKKQLENIILFLLFSLLAVVITMVLFVQENHAILVQNQLVLSDFLSENILGMIAIASMAVGVIGGFVLIGFRNQSNEKSMTMMHIWGMQRKDLCLKASIDSVIYGFLSTCIGFVLGYILFLHFAGNKLQEDITINLLSFSFQSFKVFLKVLILIVFIVSGADLYIDLKMTEKAIPQILYQRKGRHNGYHSYCILMVEGIGMALYALLVFHVKRTYLFTTGLVCLLMSLVLFMVFHFFFGVFTKKRRRTQKIKKNKDLSFCFLCSRNKRDAILSIVISAGTILLCLSANIVFNTSGLLRSAYQDNLGYTVLIRMDDFSQWDKVRNKLDELGVGYTFAYSKLADYSDLNHMNSEEGQFWALVIDRCTDGNPHFSVPAGSFLAENYFSSRCGLLTGVTSDLFGSETNFLGNLEDNQYLSLVSYNFIINKEDWKLGIDDGWNAIFLMDVSLSQEKELESQLMGFSCHMESASAIIDELKNFISDYFDILILVTGMIILVIAAIFYSVISSDLTNRKTETYLYRIFGASFASAQKIIFFEYTLIALISSFAVSFTVMVCGELYFYFGLKKHFPLSIPVVVITTAAAVLFVFLCCQTAGYVNTRNTGLEVIRDE